MNKGLSAGSVEIAYLCKLEEKLSIINVKLLKMSSSAHLLCRIVDIVTKWLNGHC